LHLNTPTNPEVNQNKLKNGPKEGFLYKLTIKNSKLYAQR